MTRISRLIDSCREEVAGENFLINLLKLPLSFYCNEMQEFIPVIRVVPRNRLSSLVDEGLFILLNNIFRGGYTYEIHGFK